METIKDMEATTATMKIVKAKDLATTTRLVMEDGLTGLIQLPTTMTLNLD
jgi:hypothetical protein